LFRKLCHKRSAEFLFNSSKSPAPLDNGAGRIVL
jgi:hypothetical protein